MKKTIEIPEGYEARIEGNKVILEPKESEDERIREEIIQFFKDASESKTRVVCSAVFAEWAAYLERQKENPKNADSIPADCASSAKCENEHNKPGDFVFELRQIISRHRYADMYGECVDDEEGMAREIMALCEQEKEQKPAEDKDAIEPTPRQDYSGLTDFERAIHRGFLCAGVENVPVCIIKDTAQDCLAQIKPAQWSEEEKMHLANAILAAEKEWGADSCTAIFLKSLRPQPHWKPSEEQMEALDDAIGMFGYMRMADTLRELYADLKKL